MPASIAACAAEVGARLERFGVDFDAAATGERWRWTRGATALDALPRPALQGEVQYANAATALAALAAGGMLPSRAAIERGLREVALAGRFQVVPGRVEWVFDVAHNEDSARVLVANVQARPARGRTHFVVGMLRDKDVAAVGRALAPLVRADDEWIAVGTDGERGLDADALAHRLAPALGRSLVTAADVPAGCRLAAAHARDGDRVLVFGSFHTVGPALEWHRLYSAAPR